MEELVNKLTNKPLNAQHDFEELLLKATQYSGSRKSGEKVISASSINRESYFLLIQHLFNKQEQSSYGANTTGSLYQLGLDSALSSHGNGRWRTAQRLEHFLPNGWRISGEYDIFDTETNTIIDGKVISDYSYKSVMKNDIDSDYNVQVATYSALEHINKKPHEIEQRPLPAKGALHIVNKGGSAAKNNVSTWLDLFMHDADTIIQMFTDKTDQLQALLDAYNKDGSLPEEVCDTAKYGMDKGVPKRCTLYCDYKDVCPHFNKNKHFIDRKIINNLSSDMPKQVEEYIKPMEF